MDYAKALARSLEVNAQLKHSQFFAMPKKEENSDSWFIVIEDTKQLVIQYDLAKTSSTQRKFHF